MFQYNRANIMIKPLAEWMEFNPVLAYGELIGVETEDKVRFKLGNGVDAFNTIPFVDDEILEALENKVDGTFTSEDAGKVLGVDEQGNVVPMTSIPSDLGDVIPRLTEVEADVDTLASNVTTEVARIDADIVGTNDYIAEVDEALEGATERLDAMEGEVALLAEAGVATDGALVTLQSDVEVMRGNITDAMTAVNLATARVDNLINELSANPEYTPAAEVVDMRTGYDGIVHPTAGAALRSVGEDLLAIREEMQTIDPDDLGLEQDELTMLVYPTFKGVRSINGIPLAGGTGGGGTGGGGGATTIIKLRNTTGSNNFTVSTGNPAAIYYIFSSVDSDDGTATGNGTASYYINEELVASLSIEQGDNSFDTAPYLKSGDNSIRLTVVDVDGNSRSLYWNITVIQIRIESNFDYTLAYPGTVTFKYTAIGDAEKTIHFILDGIAQETTTVLASNKLNTRTFENLNHGLHTLEVYATAVVNGNTVTSNKLNYDIIVTRENSLDPIISINYNVKSLLQGELVDIPYIVYDPLSTESTITLEILHVVDGVLTPYRTETRVVGNNLQHWTTRHYPLGDVTFRVSLRDLSRSITINVTELKLPVEPVTNDLELHLSAAGRSNSEVNPAIWEYNGITTTFNNVNWSSSGWINDEQGDTALHLTGGSSATINFKPFDNDIRIYGKTLEFEFAVRDVNNRDAKVITCKSGTIGIDITADKAVMSSNANSVQCHFGDNRKMRVSFTVESTSEGKLMSVYLDGVLTNVCQYDTDSFQQRPAVAIDIGSPYCSVDIYNIRIYSTALTHTEVIGNYMCDVPNIVERAEIYDSNDIYDDAGNLLFSKVKTKIPVMTIHGPLPQSKGDKKDVEISYVDPFDHSMDFDHRYCKIDVQGTSSQWYVRKNYKLKFNEKFAHIKGHIETKVYCCKADYAEATSTHNTGNANIAHTLYSDKIPPQEVDERCRTTIEGFPIVIFHQPESTLEPYFLGKYNYNYDKGSEEAFGFTDDYDVESWEFCNNTSDACNFLGPIPSDYSIIDENENEVGWVNDFERRYPDHDDIDEGKEVPNEAIARFRAMHDWVVSTKEYDLNDPTILRVDKVYDEDGNPVYELNEDKTPKLDEDGNPIQQTVGRDRKYLYREEFEQRFNLHYVLVYYVWTFFFLMVDQRAKNMFLTYWGETGKWYPYLYDNDTCLGINNEGHMSFDFYHEDTDIMENGSKVYNGQDSVLWNNFRVAFAPEIQACYQDLRSSGKLTYEEVHKYFIENQSDKWAKAIYNEDSDFKYISMLRSDNDASNLYQVRGTGEHHLEYFLNGRLNYCDSKWYATDYANDTIVIRVNTPTKINSSVQPNANITVTPFSHMYAGVRYRANGTLQQARVERNVAHTFIAPSANFTDTETAIYGASQISSIGDLSPLYCNYCDVSKAEKLIELKLGSEDAAYDSQLTKLSLGTNRLLKRLDIRNCKSLASSVNLSGCANIEEVYAEGSSITSVSLADSGYLKVLHLPNTITVLKITNQQFIEDFQLAGYEALDTLHIENVPGLPIGDILNGATNLNWVRLINVEWESTPEELEATFIKLKECGGIDANDHTAEKAVVSGLVKVPDISRELLAEINDVFPELMVSVDGVVLCTVKYYNYNGDVLYTTTVPRGTNAPDIVEDELIDYIPSRPQTDEYRYEYKGWSDSLENIQRSKSFIAMYNVFYGVRFFNDGNEAYRVYVPYGTELEDPIPNHIAEPTKAQTVSHTYTYVGWDKDISNIVEPLVVNAVFHEALRQYEITFRNEGEEEPLEVKMVDYGTYPVYTGATPVKQGVAYPQDYAFIGWTPSIDGVKGDTTYTAKFADSDHILDNWETVKANIANGTYKDKYPIGILQRVTLATGEEIDVELVGYDHDSTESGATAALTFIAKKLPSTTYRMADANVGTIGGWKDCDMRRFLNGEFIELLPSDLRSVITPVVKYASTGAGAANSANSVIPVIDTLWLPSITEVCAHYYTSDNKLYSAEGKPYDLYAPYTMDTPAAQAIRKKVTVNSVSQVKYWLRTPVYMNGSIYYAINIDGAANAFTRIEKACHIAFGFCIN